MELIGISASKAAASSKISVNLSSGMMAILAEMKGEETFGTAQFAFECPLENVAARQETDTGSKSMVNLKSRQFGISDGNVNFGRTISEDDKTYSFMKEEVCPEENHKFGAESLSSDSTVGSDQCWGSVSQGALQCAWRGGSPHFVFSVDGQKEVYVANLSADDKSPDHVYLLHSTKNTRKAHEIESHLVGKMKVSTSFTLCPNNSRIMETEFILYGTNDEVDLLEKHVAPNFELAAIVVREHVPDKRQGGGGGWGLKFLKNDDGRDEAVTCALSMDIIVPAGLHGGPKTRNDSPSSLIKRWKSGGSCDCGGWDMGCPLTLLNAQPSKQGECEAFDLAVKASEHSSPTLRMETVHGGLYLVQFQSILSALQSFSIAVAFMHTRRLKVYF